MTLTKWDSVGGRRLLRQVEAGKRTLATLDLEDWEHELLARALRARNVRPRRRAPSPVQWARSLAFELDELRGLAAARRLAVARFDRSGFRGSDAQLERLLLSAGSPSSQNPWNTWRRRAPRSRPDLRGARLTGLDLRFFDLRRLRLEGGDLSGSQLRLCNLAGADLRRVHMRHTDLSHATLRSAKLNGAVIEASLLVDADLSDADLRGATLIECLLNRANLSGTKLAGAVTWGIGAWDLDNAEEARHRCLVVVGGDLDPDDYDVKELRRPGQTVLVDNIETAHVVELLANNEKIGAVLRAAASRLVLLLGRFEGEQAEVLEALKTALPRHGYAPIKFDFDQGPDRDLVETVTMLASLSRFVVADLTAPRSVPLEAQAIVPDVAVPFVPILRGQRPFSMFSALQRKYFWVLPTLTYRSGAHLVRSLKTGIIEPAERMVKRLRRLKSRG